MRKRTRDDDMPQGKVYVVTDFLPPPEKLLFPTDKVKVTIYLDRLSVDFFKQKAKKHRAKYQRMIREVIDRYVQRYRNT